MKSISLFVILLFSISCNQSANLDLKMNKVYELHARKTYSGLNESEQDSLRKSNPEITDLKLEKAGLIKNGQLQMEKFQTSKFILRNSARKFLEVSCDLDKSTAQPKVISRLSVI